jgi:hypothetical protein
VRQWHDDQFVDGVAEQPAQLDNSLARPLKSLIHDP